MPTLEEPPAPPEGFTLDAISSSPSLRTSDAPPTPPEGFTLDAPAPPAAPSPAERTLGEKAWDLGKTAVKIGVNAGAGNIPGVIAAFRQPAPAPPQKTYPDLIKEATESWDKRGVRPNLPPLLSDEQTQKRNEISKAISGLVVSDLTQSPHFNGLTPYQKQQLYRQTLRAALPDFYTQQQSATGLQDSPVDDYGVDFSQGAIASGVSSAVNAGVKTVAEISQQYDPRRDELPLKVDPQSDKANAVGGAVGGAIPVVAASVVNPIAGAVVGGLQGTGSTLGEYREGAYTPGQAAAIASERGIYGAVLGLLPGGKAAEGASALGGAAKTALTVYGLNVTQAALESQVRQAAGIHDEGTWAAVLKAAASGEGWAQAILFGAAHGVAMKYQAANAPTDHNLPPIKWAEDTENQNASTNGVQPVPSEVGERDGIRPGNKPGEDASSGLSVGGGNRPLSEEGQTPTPPPGFTLDKPNVAPNVSKTATQVLPGLENTGKSELAINSAPGQQTEIPGAEKMTNGEMDAAAQAQAREKLGENINGKSQKELLQMAASGNREAKKELRRQGFAPGAGGWAARARGEGPLQRGGPLNRRSYAPDDPIIDQNIKTAHDAIVDAGGALRKESESGSRYYDMPDGSQIRLSDHQPNDATSEWMERNGVEDVRADSKNMDSVLRGFLEEHGSGKQNSNPSLEDNVRERGRLADEAKALADKYATGGEPLRGTIETAEAPTPGEKPAAEAVPEKTPDFSKGVDRAKQTDKTIREPSAKGEEKIPTAMGEDIETDRIWVNNKTGEIKNVTTDEDDHHTETAARYPKKFGLDKEWAEEKISKELYDHIQKAVQENGWVRTRLDDSKWWFEGNDLNAVRRTIEILKQKLRLPEKIVIDHHENGKRGGLLLNDKVKINQFLKEQPRADALKRPTEIPLEKPPEGGKTIRGRDSAGGETPRPREAPLPQGKIEAGEQPVKETPASPQATDAGVKSDKPTQAVGAAHPESKEFEAPRPTGIKHATVAAERKKLGMPERQKWATVKDDEVIDAAVQRHINDSTHGENLVDSLLKRPRSLEIEETADLLVHQRSLLNERTQLEDAIIKADAEGGDAESLRDQLAANNKSLENNFKVTEFAGTRQGLAFRARRWMMNEGYTLGEMERSARAAKGSELTDGERAKLKDLSEKIASSEKRLKALQDMGEAELRKRLLRHTFDKLKAEHEKESYRASRDKKPLNIAEKRDRLVAGLKDAGDSSDGWIREIFKTYVAEGVERKEAHLPENREKYLDQTFASVKKELPDIAREQVSDAITGYGDFKLLSKAEADVQTRQYRGELLKIAQLQEVNERNRAPQKTGAERQSPSDEARRLDKQLRERMKALGIATGDPETQLKTALQSRKTYYENRMKDLRLEIAKREKTVKGDTPSPTDAELEAMKTEYATVKAEHEAVFGKPGMSDVERLDAAIKSADRIDKANRQKIADNNPFNMKRAPLTSPELEAAKARAEESRETLQHLRDLREDQEWEPGTPAEAARLKALREDVVRLNDKIAKADIGPEQGPEEPKSPAVMAMEKQRDLANQTISDMRKAAKPKKSPEEIALQAKKTYLLNRLGQLAEKVVTGDYAPIGPKEGIKLNPELLKIQAEVNQWKKVADRGKFEFEQRNRTFLKKTLDFVGQVLAVPRAATTSWDLPPVFRQGGFVNAAHPIQAMKNFVEAVKAYGRAPDLDSLRGLVDPKIREQNKLGREKNALESWEKIKSGKHYELSQRAGLELTDLSAGKHEEQFNSRLAQSIPGVAASERNFTTFMNATRANAFSKIVDSFYKGDVPISDAKIIANYVNIATGRGELGSLAHAANALSLGLFSPRLWASRLQLLTGQPLWTSKGGINPKARAIVATEYVRSIGGILAILALGAAAGATVEKDPRSSDFGKMRFGNTRLDPWAGLAQNAVFLSREATGETKTLGGEVKSIRGAGLKTDGADVLFDFLRSKEAPIPGAITNILAGQDAVGNPTTPKSMAQGMLMPMIFGDVAQTLHEQGLPKGLIISALGAMGMGVQNFVSSARKADNSPLGKFLTEQRNNRPFDYKPSTPEQKKKWDSDRKAIERYRAEEDPADAIGSDQEALKISAKDADKFKEAVKYVDDNAQDFLKAPVGEAMTFLEEHPELAKAPAKKGGDSYLDAVEERVRGLRTVTQDARDAFFDRIEALRKK